MILRGIDVKIIHIPYKKYTLVVQNLFGPRAVNLNQSIHNIDLLAATALLGKENKLINLEPTEDNDDTFIECMALSIKSGSQNKIAE